MTAFTLRHELAESLSPLVAPVPVYEEQPDSLTPPAVVIEWQSTAPSDTPGFVDHSIAAVVIPYTDLTATSGPSTHYASRDEITESVIDGIRQWTPPRNAGSGAWEAATDERDIGGQTVRVAVVLVQVTESILC